MAKVSTFILYGVFSHMQKFWIFLWLWLVFFHELAIYSLVEAGDLEKFGIQRNYM